MANGNLAYLGATLLMLSLGSLGLIWARGEEKRLRTRWGRRMCRLAVVLLGAVTIAAVLFRPEVLAPQGLLSGLLVIGMLWDSPTPGWQRGGS